jgi:hypothetical protein
MAFPELKLRCDIGWMRRVFLWKGLRGRFQAVAGLARAKVSTIAIAYFGALGELAPARGPGYESTLSGA